jgi:integrase
MASVPRMKHTIRRAEIYARSEVEAILSAPRQPRDRAFLMTVYACGLRLAEARHLNRPATLTEPGCSCEFVRVRVARSVSCP